MVEFSTAYFTMMNNMKVSEANSSVENPIDVIYRLITCKISVNG